MPRIEQYRESRYRMLDLEYSDYEEEIRNHLGRMPNEKLFDFDRDIVSFAMNYWAQAVKELGSGTQLAELLFKMIVVIWTRDRSVRKFH